MKSPCLAFLLILVSATALAKDPCPVKNLVDDYANLYGEAEKGASFLYQEITLTKSLEPALLVAEELSCGSQGCEYALYQPIRKGCLRRLASFVGHFQLLKTEHGGHLDFKVGQETYAYDPRSGAYIGR